MTETVTLSRAELAATISEILEDKVAGLKQNRDDLISEKRKEADTAAALRAENAELKTALAKAHAPVNDPDALKAEFTSEFGDNTNPFHKASFNLTRAARIIKADPEKAKALIRIAGTDGEPGMRRWYELNGGQ